MFDIDGTFCDDRIVKHQKSNLTLISGKIPVSILVGVTVVILVAAISILGYYFLQTNSFTSSSKQSVANPTNTPAAESWNTYANPDQSFFIDYPSKWSIRDFENGVAFNPISMPGYPDKSDSITITTGEKLANYKDDTLEEYVKKAGEEIQNYGKLISLKRVVTNEGAVGYGATWEVKPLSGKDSDVSVSQPITYFELPSSKTKLLRVVLDRKDDLVVYEKMLQTIKFKSPLNIEATPKPEENSVLEDVVGKSISQKSGVNQDSLIISVSTIEGNYAKGMVSDKTSGGIWFAAKVDGVWKLVWDGNGIIKCSDLSLYPDFSSNLIPECFDDAKQSMINR